MGKVITNKEKIDELLTRGVADVIEPEHLRKRLSSGDVLRVKLGIDPTSVNLHLGHTVPLRKLRQFQDMGHQAVLIIGDATAMIGDPTGRSEMRQKLTREEVEENKKTYLEQAAKVLDMKKLEVHHNGEWFFPMSAQDFLELTSLVTVQQILQREDFKKRVDDPEHPLSAIELTYPIMQGFDSVQIKADIEIGGHDQLLNLLMGRRLQRKFGQPEQDVLTFDLMVGTDGVRKMSKSFGNDIPLESTAEDMYGLTMSISDDVIIKYFELLTEWSRKEIDDLKKQIKQGMNPRDAKAQLAFELVKMYHGEKVAKKVEEGFAAQFQQGNKPDEIAEVDISEKDIVSVLVETELCSSKSDARRNIDGGGVKLNDEKVESYEIEVNSGDVIQKGKRYFVKIK